VEARRDLPSPFEILASHFAVSFGLGRLGIVMPFQFGTNWSRFSDAQRTSSLHSGIRGLVAFFLEAGFLGVLLFGASWCALGAFHGSSLRSARYPLVLDSA
jgi:cytochrome bd-type quinol oxidase subunit 1